MFSGHSAVKVIRNASVNNPSFTFQNYFTADANYYFILVPKSISTGSVGVAMAGNREFLRYAPFNFFPLLNIKDSVVLSGESISFQNINITFDLFLFSMND